MSASDQAIYARSQSTLLQGKVALVCGGTDGVGRISARFFAAHGAWVAVAFRSDLAGARGLADQIRSDGGRAILVPGDVGTREGAWQVARYVEHEWGHIDVLLNASLVTGQKEERPHDHSIIVRELLPDMQKRAWGRIVTFWPPGDDSADRSIYSPAPLDAKLGAPELTGQPPAYVISLAGGLARGAATEEQTGEQLYQAAASVALSLCITGRDGIVEGVIINYILIQEKQPYAR